MSLLDALLLDPARINVWIAYRTDGIKGTGTQNDPRDGSTSFAATPVSGLTNRFERPSVEVFREVNDGPDQYAYGIRHWRCENAVAEHNVIDPGVGFPVNQYKSGTLEYFDNTTPAGVLIQGYDTTAARKVDELTTRVEDSLTMALL